jgi:hypothetical protein
VRNEPVPTAEQFAERVKDHVVNVRHNDGIYRHLYCAKPGTGFDSFHITTWPGYLAYSGDMGTFVFWRTDDMFTFFRRDDHEINPGYWAEKLEASDRTDGHETFSVERFRELVISETREYLELEDGVDIPDDIGQEIDHLIGADDEYECVAEMRSHDSDVIPLNDFWEHDCKAYTYRFIFCCRALVWAIAKYDEACVNGDALATGGGK